jgi:hypothetical protein
MARSADMDKWTLSDWEEWDAELNAKLDPEWAKKYGRQSFEAALTLFGYGSLLPGSSMAKLPKALRQRRKARPAWRLR